MLKKKILFLTCAIILSIALVGCQTANVAYLGLSNKASQAAVQALSNIKNNNSNNNSNNNKMIKNFNLLLNTKLRDGKLIMEAKLVNTSGRSQTLYYNEDSLFSYTIFDSEGNAVYISPNQTSISAIRSSKVLKPGRSKDFDFVGEWRLLDNYNTPVVPGKYRVKVSLNVYTDRATMVKDPIPLSIERNFVVHAKDVANLRPATPPTQRDVVASVDAKVEDRALKITVALENKTTEKISIHYNNHAMFDIIILDERW